MSSVIQASRVQENIDTFKTFVENSALEILRLSNSVDYIKSDINASAISRAIKPPDENIYNIKQPRIKDLRFMAGSLNQSPKLKLLSNKITMNSDLKNSYFFNKIKDNDRILNNISTNSKIVPNRQLILDSFDNQNNLD